MRSVSGRLTLQFVALTGLVLAVFGGSLDLRLAGMREQALNAELDVPFLVVQQSFLSDRAAVEAYLARSGLDAEVRDPGGSLMYRSDGFALRSEARRTRSGRLRGPDGEEGSFTLAGSPPSPDPARSRFRIYFAVFAPLTLIAAGAVGFVLARRAMAPLEAIRRQAELISRTNVSERVPEAHLSGEFRALARTTNEMLERLERAIQDLQNFAADAAHELRTPLANLRAEIETTVQKERAAQEYERVLASLSEEVARMSRIVGDLFTLAKLDLPGGALQKERIRLRPLLEETRETWAPVAGERKIRLHLEGSDAVVQGDPVALRRVFMNLIENAVKYNRDGGDVTISVERRGGKGIVRVEDTGIGISREHLPKLFRRFYRVDQDRTRERGGAGLGLAICKSFVDAHEGTIQVASTPGEGSVFVVELSALD